MGTEMSLCAVIGAGEIRDYNAVAGLLSPGVFVICADGGLAHCARLGLAPQLLVGDFDSLGGNPPPAGVPTVPLSVDKNYTDSYHACQEGAERGYRRFLLTGMLGGRLDHTLANLGLLTHLAKEGMEAVITDGLTEARVLWGEGELVLPHRPGCYFSLIAPEPCRGVTILGGKYPLDDYPLAFSDPRAVSNEFAGGPVTIRQKEGLLLVLSEPKGSGLPPK